MATRAERKAKQRAHFAQMEQINALSAQQRALNEQRQREERLRFEREHPVLSGVVPVVEYQEPQWRYGR